MPPARTIIRRAALTLLALVTLVLAIPTAHLARTWLRDKESLPATPRHLLDDASHLNATRVGVIIDVAPEQSLALAQIRDAFRRAARENKKVSIAGFRHSMGGQTIAPDGIVLNMLRYDHTHYDRHSTLITVGAGATWDLVIPYLDRFGRSVEVMQSDSPFTVGGSLGVNAHGWQPERSPVASTVDSFTLVTPDGALKFCSRTRNQELFAAAIGGYGMFGVILDATLRTVPNERYRRHVYYTSSAAFEETYRREVEAMDDAALAYGRLSVSPDAFLEEAILTVHRRLPGEPPPLEWEDTSDIERLLFRGSLRSELGKRLRWFAERHLSDHFYDREATRNHLMDGDIELYTNRSGEERDILHEYFIPRGRLARFVDSARQIVRKHEVELLNVTLRDVKRDRVTLLPYAKSDVMAAVMFFSQRPTADDEQRMRRATADLIDAALREGGTYYLPYRLHARPGQFRAAYPECAEFFALKKKYDPRGVLRTRWSDHYSSACSE